MSDFIAHVKRNDDGTWAPPQLLVDHLMGTAAMAEEFAAVFQSGEWGKAIGLAHDAGKGRELWQKYLKIKSEYDETAHLEGKRGKIPHAIYGSELVEKLYGKGIGRFLSYGIAGHHAGLPDWSGAEGAGKTALEYQKSQNVGLDDILKEIKDVIHQAKPQAPPWKFDRGLDLSLWIRMLYSCLVDADFLDTEHYMDQEHHLLRGGYLSIEELQDRLLSHLELLKMNAMDSHVNRIRNTVQDRCMAVAKESKGIFSLSVPTGGGKTLSSLAFALEHAKLHGLSRIIYVIPYTSIIEQTADVFRHAIGQDQVVEHHSNLDQEEDSPKSRISAENWDAPIIVTTSVQFFESLFASKSSRCRKLHNICNAVVILDEAQLVPVEYLDPILETMQLLVDHYQVSFVISTATQPAFQQQGESRTGLRGLRQIREIMGTPEEVNQLYREMMRTDVEFPEDLFQPTSLEDLANKLLEHPQALCIVSDRKSCLELHRLMPKGTYHLSSLMCGQHRSEVIREIKEKLSGNETVRVVSTQLVEAGVDVDFPIVFKSFAGLDSIAQAAGRCNREGKLQRGKVIVFLLPRSIPSGILRKAADVTRSMLQENLSGVLDYHSFPIFFHRLFSSANSLDLHGIADFLKPDPKECGIYFRTASAKFKLINDANQKSILVRYGEGEGWIDDLRSNGPSRALLRNLQRYTVTVYDTEFHDLLKRRVIEEAMPGVFALATRLDYSEKTGLHLTQTEYDPEQFIC